jgi:hypothetical protein
VAAAFAAAILIRTDFPWQSQGLNCATRLRAPTRGCFLCVSHLWIA